MSRLKGVHGQTGQPQGTGPIVPSAMNVIEAFGLFPRRFESVVVMQGEADREFIMGDAPQEGKYSWYVLNDMIEKASPQALEIHLDSFIGTGAAQAHFNINDSNLVETARIAGAYRGVVSYGVYDNDTGFTISNQYPVTTALASDSTSSPTELVLNTVVGLSVGTILEIALVVSGATTLYGFKITAIDESTKTVTGTADVGCPILTTGSVVRSRAVYITAYRRDYRKQISKVQTSFNTRYVTFEPEDTANYIGSVFATHPLFSATNLSSTTSATEGWLKRFPPDTTTGSYNWLAGGLDGASPASTSDWTSLQDDFMSPGGGPRSITGKTFAVINCESTSKAVHQSYQAWCESRYDFPIYLGPIQDFGSDYQSLGDFGVDFIRRTGWAQILLVYGWRYVADPIGGANAVIKIPVHGGVLGRWIRLIYSGYVHRAPAEPRFYDLIYLDGPTSIPEDPPSSTNPTGWDDTIRTYLYDRGVDIVQNFTGFGTGVRNFRTPSEDVLVRDAHIHAINQCIKFTSEQNLAVTENQPNQRKFLSQMAQRIDYEILKPLFEGNFIPYCVDRETGAFKSEKPDGTPAEWFDVSGTQADTFNNPPAQFDLGNADLWPQWIPYSLQSSLFIKVFTTVKLFA